MRKINQVLRLIVQILSFILMPGLVISAFSSIREIGTFFIKGESDISQITLPIIILITIFGTTAILGRFFCGYVCSFGFIQDILFFISSKIIKRPIKVGKKLDKILKGLKFIILALIVIFIWPGIVTIASDFSPWTIFGIYSDIKGWSNLSSFISIGGLLLLLIMIGSFFIERFFCRYLCPLGAIFTVISKMCIFKIKKPREACGTCKLCSHKCSMAIDLSTDDEVKSGECIDCQKCVDVCPKKNVKTTSSSLLTGLILGLVILFIPFIASQIRSNTDAAIPSLIDDNKISSTGKYKDGSYEGSASGYRGTTKVKVEVVGGNISSITLLSTEDDKEFFNRSWNKIVKDIIEKQEMSVDAVSGATYSSNAIKNAVANALEGANLDESDNANDTESPNEENASSELGNETKDTTNSSNNQSDLTAIARNVADGKYTGSGSGFRGTTKVEVEVVSGKIINISLISTKDDTGYFDAAWDGVTSEIINAQSTEVDAVSGATYSSNAIKEAVANALGASYDNPNSGSISSGGGHRGRKHKYSDY